MHAEVEDEVVVDGVVHAAGEVGLVVVFSGDADVFNISTGIFDEIKAENGGVEELEFVVAGVFVEEVVELRHEFEPDGVGEGSS